MSDKTREQWMADLKSDGMIGYDQSPGDPVAEWAHSRILELEQTLRYIAGVDVPNDPYFRVAVESRLGMRAIALGVLNIADEAPDKNPVITGLKPFKLPLCDEEGCTQYATLRVIDPADGEAVGFSCETHAHVDGLEYRDIERSDVDFGQEIAEREADAKDAVDVGRHIDDHEQYD